MPPYNSINRQKSVNIYKSFDLEDVNKLLISELHDSNFRTGSDDAGSGFSEQNLDEIRPRFSELEVGENGVERGDLRAVKGLNEDLSRFNGDEGGKKRC